MRLFFICHLTLFILSAAHAQTGRWMKYEQTFQSQKTYENPLYDVKSFTVKFTSPAGKVHNIAAFWDGGTTWRVRFAPDETGTWNYATECSDKANTGLDNQKGTFQVVDKASPHDIYSKGGIVRPKASYSLSHADGTPFFYTACTAWNGALKSTEAEWDAYLKDRVANHYNVIQFVTTQWRGGSKNSKGQVAFTGSGRIALNPEFFQHLDKKVDEINAHGLVAAPVLLWALPNGLGRELSPGYYLPDQEAILLAKYMVARYGGHQIIWILGGDGEYQKEFEQRWKTIGRGVFGGEHRDAEPGNAQPPGIVAQHPHGGSWIGQEYAHEDWLDIVGYQTGHNARPNTQKWITGGPVAKEWAQLPPKVFINLEPIYEDIDKSAGPADIRNASYWSVFSTPVAGITYGGNGVWPWIRPGEEIENHGKPHILRTWDESIKQPGSLQIGYLAEFMRKYDWWQLKPAQDLLMENKEAGGFISVVRSDDRGTIMAYLPQSATVKLYNPSGVAYLGKWFDPVSNKYSDAKLQIKSGVLEATSPGAGDMVLVLTRK